MRSSSELMYRARQVSNLGGFMSGVNNNGAHSANGITAMFIATGQDAANVAESSAAFVYAELRDNGDYYYSVTIPSLIVATYGGGTGAGDPARVPGAARLLRQGQGAQVHGDRRGDGALRRALARVGDRRGGVGQRPRPPRAATVPVDERQRRWVGWRGCRPRCLLRAATNSEGSMTPAQRASGDRRFEPPKRWVARSRSACVKRPAL